MTGKLSLFLRFVASFGPFALIFATYSLLLDHLPQSWFTSEWPFYLLAAVAAIAVGLSARALLQTGPARRLLGEPGALASAMLPGAPTAPVRKLDANRVFRQARDKVLEGLETSQRGDLTLVGWSHYFGIGGGVSAVGTLYGSRILLMMDWHDAKIRRSDLLRTLLNLQCEGGGWAARSQRGVGRIESSSWALRTAAHLGLPLDEQADLVANLERMLDVDVDPVGMSRTSVICAAVTCLAEVAPESDSLDRLVRNLMAAATVDGSGGETHASWGQALHEGAHPTTAHTAHAVVALQTARRAIGWRGRFHRYDGNGTAAIDDAIRRGCRYLVSCDDRALLDEQIRRGIDQVTETLYVSHFTPAWYALALMSGERSDRATRQIHAAMQEVMQYEFDGVWRWPGRDGAPIWMTQQGLLALRQYCYFLALADE